MICSVLYQDQRVFITPNVEPDREMVENLVKAVHGKVLSCSYFIEMLITFPNYHHKLLYKCLTCYFHRAHNVRDV